MRGHKYCFVDIRITDKILLFRQLTLVPPLHSRECFLSFPTGNFGKVYLGNNYACNIEGLVTMRVAMENGQELTLDQVVVRGVA